MSEVQQDETRRKKMLVLAIVGVIVVLGIVITYIYKAQQKYIPQPPPPKIELQGTKDLAKESWIAQSSSQMQEQKKRIEEIQNSMKSLEDKVDKNAKISQDKAPLGVPPVTTAGRGIIPPPPPPPSSSGTHGTISTMQPQGAITQQTERVIKHLIAVDEGKITKTASKLGENPGGNDNREEFSNERVEHDNKPYLPAGSFVETVLLSGIDAPSGSKGTGSPYPVLLRVLSLAQFPNKWRGDIKECFVIGEAYGELSSERVHIRANTLSCVDRKGELIEGSITGYATGEDGKIGLSGRVVTKQGAILARSLVTGFLQGVSQAFSQSATVVNVGTTGAISTIDPDKTMQAGIGMGVSKAAEDLAQFYIDMARDMFPVIEVNSGRRAEIIFVNRVALSKVR